MSIFIIVAAKYQIAPSKAVVGVDRPIKALSCIYKSHINEKLSKFSQLSFCQAVILSKNIYSKPNSFMHMFNVSLLNRQSIKSLHRKLW